jgi:glycosyltransferase involved in cell wall biosynthesis
MSVPFISICIPSYKNVAYLQRLLNSIVIQTFKNYEIIITDDSPGDEVKRLLGEYQNFSISYYKNQPPLGMPSNWNEGIKKAKGEWIKIMHDDDWFATSSSLEQFATVAKIAKHDFIFSACSNIDISSGKETPELLKGWRKEMIEENILNLFYHNVIGHPSTVMHRKDENILYDDQFKWLVDIDFYMDYLMRHSGFEYIDEILVNIGIDENQASNKYYKNPEVEIPEYFNLLNKFPVKLKDNKFVFHAFWLLLRKFKIKSLAEIKKAGYEGDIPEEISEIIRYQKYIPRIILKQTPQSNYFMQRCFNKLSS